MPRYSLTGDSSIKSTKDGGLTMTTGDGAAVTFSNAKQGDGAEAADKSFSIGSERFGHVEYLGFNCGLPGCYAVSPSGRTQSITGVASFLVSGVSGMYQCVFTDIDTNTTVAVADATVTTEAEASRAGKFGSSNFYPADRRISCTAPDFPFSEVTQNFHCWHTSLALFSVT